MTRRTRADALLSDLPDFNVGLALPDPISARLDDLVELANGAGARTSRKELIASLLLATVPSDQDLAETVRRYRTARARDALLDDNRAAMMLTFTPRKPGPRIRRPATRGASTSGRS